MKAVRNLLIAGAVCSSSLVMASEGNNYAFTGLDVFTKQQVILNINTQIEFLEAQKKLKELQFEEAPAVVGDQPEALPAVDNNIQWLNPTAPPEGDKLEDAFVDSAYIPLGETEFIAVVNVNNSNMQVEVGDELYGWKITAIKAGRIDLKHTETKATRSLGDGTLTVQ